MTEREREIAIETLQNQINGVIAYLVMLDDIAKENGTTDLHPILQDTTVKTLLKDYRKLSELRDY